MSEKENHDLGDSVEKRATTESAGDNGFYIVGVGRFGRWFGSPGANVPRHAGR